MNIDPYNNPFRFTDYRIDLDTYSIVRVGKNSFRILTVYPLNFLMGQRIIVIL